MHSAMGDTSDKEMRRKPPPSERDQAGGRAQDAKPTRSAGASSARWALLLALVVAAAGGAGLYAGYRQIQQLQGGLQRFDGAIAQSREGQEDMRQRFAQMERSLEARIRDLKQSYEEGRFV